MNKTFRDVLTKRVDVVEDTAFAMSSLLNACRGKKLGATLTGKSLIIMTTFGSIYCEMVCDKEANLSPTEALVAEALKMRDEGYESQDPDKSMIPRGRTILLKSVTVSPFQCPSNLIKYDVLALFTDQIVGVAIGSLE